MKRLTMQWIMVLLSMWMFSSICYGAAKEAEPPPAPERAANPDFLNFASGKAGKGYSKFVNDMLKVCPDLPINQVQSEGGLNNLTLLSTKDADVALVAADTLVQMQNSDDNLKSLQVVSSLHTNIMHILTRKDGFDTPGTGQKLISEAVPGKFGTSIGAKEAVYGPADPVHVDINEFSDLKGKLVGLVGSQQLMVRKLNDAAGHGMTFIDFSGETADADAIKALQEQKVFAVFTGASWPSGPVSKLKPSDGVKLINYNLTATPPYSIVKKNYSNLGQYGVAFLGVPNLIVTRPFTPGGTNARNVAKIRECISANLAKLKDGRYEPGWNDVTDLNKTYELPRFEGK